MHGFRLPCSYGTCYLVTYKRGPQEEMLNLKKKKNTPSYYCFIFRGEKKTTKKSPGVPKSMNYGTDTI